MRRVVCARARSLAGRALTLRQNGRQNKRLQQSWVLQGPFRPGNLIKIACATGLPGSLSRHSFADRRGAEREGPLWVEPGYPGRATGRPPLGVASGCVSRPLLPSDVCLLGESQSVVHLNTEITHRAFQLGVAQQKLDSTKIAGPPIDQRHLRPAQGVRAV